MGNHLMLVDYTGSLFREAQAGISREIAAIFERLGTSAKALVPGLIALLSIQPAQDFPKLGHRAVVASADLLSCEPQLGGDLRKALSAEPVVVHDPVIHLADLGAQRGHRQRDPLVHILNLVEVVQIRRAGRSVALLVSGHTWGTGARAGQVDEHVLSQRLQPTAELALCGVILFKAGRHDTPDLLALVLFVCVLDQPPVDQPVDQRVAGCVELVPRFNNIRRGDRSVCAAAQIALD
jgi:hypothetical protein